VVFLDDAWDISLWYIQLHEPFSISMNLVVYVCHKVIFIPKSRRSSQVREELWLVSNRRPWFSTHRSRDVNCWEGIKVTLRLAVSQCLDAERLLSFMRHGSNRKRRLQQFFVAAGASLPSSYLATTEGHTDRPCYSSERNGTPENDVSNNYSISVCIRCGGNVFTEPLPIEGMKDTFYRAFAYQW
jgi:hypothetical protein